MGSTKGMGLLLFLALPLFPLFVWEEAYSSTADDDQEDEDEEEEVFGPMDGGGGGDLRGAYADVLDDLWAQRNATHDWCPSTCRCPSPSSSIDGHLRCKGGVSIVRDGCDCCFVCARQQGDVCDRRSRCDEDKLMHCDYTTATATMGSTMVGSTRTSMGSSSSAAAAATGQSLPDRYHERRHGPHRLLTSDDGADGGARGPAKATGPREEEQREQEGPMEPRGICRAKLARPCDVNGKRYEDGAHFRLNCSQLCTCQNGNYACASLCPQEDIAPSSGHCLHPQLTSIGERCCKEWVCPHSHHHPHHRQRPLGPDDDDDDDRRLGGGVGGGCVKETTGWSACSVTCDVGWSIRLTSDEKCVPVQERRLCIVRPCRLQDRHLQPKECKNTWRQDEPARISHSGCTSIKEFRPKYCSTCKRHRCCRPDLAKTLVIDMQCSTNQRTVTEKLMWIKSCRCKASYCRHSG